MFRPLALALLLPALAHAAPKPVRAMLAELDRRELVEDALEAYFDSKICGPIKGGLHQLPEELGPAVQPDASHFASVASCSLRPLRLEPTATGATAHLLWELEGHDRSGQRAVERGEGEVVLTKTPTGGWRFDSYTPEYRKEGARPAARYTEVADQLGLVLPPPIQGPLTGLLIMQGGLAVRDLDGDGRAEVIAVNGERAYLFKATGEAGAPESRYRRSTLGPELPLPAWYGSPIVADFDGDGDPDVILATVGGPSKIRSSVYRNDGGALVPVQRLPIAGQFQSGIALDVNSDGKLDLLLVAYQALDSVPDNYLEARNGAPMRVLLGNGDLTFREQPLPAELRKRRWGLAAASAELTEALPQVYIANDFGSNDLWTFHPDGKVTETAAQHGLTDPGNGMSVDYGDVNGDGKLDLYVANMFSKAGTRVIQAATVPPEQRALLEKFSRGNTLYVADGSGGFSEQATQLGAARGLWAFGSIFTDLDDDGRLDIAVANGFRSAPNRKDL